MITPAQWRAARALLDWPQADFASYLGIEPMHVLRLETGHGPVPEDVRAQARAALEDAGVIFIDSNGEGPGVRLRKSP